MDFHPPQGAHTSHLRTLSKIISSPNQHPVNQEHFARGSRALYIPFQDRQHPRKIFFQGAATEAQRRTRLSARAPRYEPRKCVW